MLMDPDSEVHVIAYTKYDSKKINLTCRITDTHSVGGKAIIDVDALGIIDKHPVDKQVLEAMNARESVLVEGT